MTTRWVVAGLLALGVQMAVPVASQAAPAYRQRGNATYDIGFNRGQREGFDEGLNDSRKGHRFELYREGDYREADEGYRSNYGPKRVYVTGFRAGFEQGYRRGFAQYNNGHRDSGYWQGDHGYGRGEVYRKTDSGRPNDYGYDRRRDDDYRYDDDY
jgi:hypothetical protein